MHIIAATNAFGGIGWQGHLPWHNSEDLQFFKQKTSGQTVLMGRKTWQSLPNALSGRHNLVLSSQLKADEEHVSWVSCLQQAAAIAHDRHTELWIIGGASVYQQALPYAQTACINVIFGKHCSDVWFPPMDNRWKLKHYTIDVSGTFASQLWINDNPKPLSS